MSVAGNRLRTASRIFSLGLALVVIRAAVACGGSSSDVESDACKRRQGHCASGGATAMCNREEVAFVDTCLCCVPAAKAGDDDDDDDDTVADSGAAADSAPEAATPVADAGGNDAADAGD